ncbi:MAG: hypothetical protein L3K00_03055 [Thermoplasmata archaeon]|nr:hypothetical protein [Thermoplasmata archaeon]
MASSTAPLVLFPPDDHGSVDVEIWSGSHFRISLELLDDCAARKLRLDQLRDLIVVWITERPNDPVPRTVDELVCQLVR